MNSFEIIETFSFDESARSTYPFLDDYTRRIRNDLPRLIRRPASRDRYCIVGLFVTYRAFNHWGESLDTTMNLDEISEPFRSRLKAFRVCTGRDICSTQAYIRLLGYGRILRFIPFYGIGLGRSLAGYVRKKSSPWPG